MQTLKFAAMHCEMSAIIDRDEQQMARHLAQVPLWFAEWESHLSRFRLDSELCRLNRSHGKPFVVSDVLWEVVQTALLAAEWTEGLVTPTVLGAMEQTGYDQSFEVIKARGGTGRIAAPSPIADWRDIVCEADSRTICLPVYGRLDLGGIVKGWAAEEAVRQLSRYGPALVDAGGEIAISGSRFDGSPWPIGVVDPGGSVIETLMLTVGAVATSGWDHRYWHQGNARQHHILDPHTALPARTDVLTATVVAPNAWQAEAAAKAVIILGSQNGLAWLENHPGLAGLLICADGRILRSERLEAHLWNQNP
jgi:FAD:protein FMN transferase